MIEPAILTTIALGVVQGLTEFLPISSSGHLILAHELLGATSSLDLTFDALLHFATAFAIVVYFWRDIRDLIVAGLQLVAKMARGVRELTSREQTVVALIIGTIPAVVLGLLLEDIMATLFRSPQLVGVMLIVGSLVMLAAEHWKRWRETSVLHTGWKKGLILGLFQSLALIPGMSRSGMTISGGMLFGLSREDSAKFGFLLGVPVLLGAGAKKALELGLADITLSIVVGTLTAFVVAMLVIHYLLKYLRSHTLHVFIVYRILLALTIIVVFTVLY